jgi:exodeoxyribonuclease III
VQDAGYHAAWKGEKAWNGVAVLSKSAEPVVTRTSLPGNPSDYQSRYIEAAIGGILIGCLYAPNGNPQPGPKFTYKLAWLDRLAKHAAKLIKQDVPAVLVGDYNVVPTPFDIYPSKSWANDALVQPESRAAYKRIVDQGWIDAIRALNPDQPMYTFWHYLRNRWERDAGLRLDHLLVSPSLSEGLIAGGVDREVRGQQGASDHAPAWILLGQ